MVSEPTMEYPSHVRCEVERQSRRLDNMEDKMQWIKEAIGYLLRAKFGEDSPLALGIPVRTREELLGTKSESLPILQTQPYEPPTDPKLELQGNKMELLLEEHQKSDSSLENFVEHLACDPPVLQEQCPIARSVHRLDCPEKKDKHPFDDDEYSKPSLENFVEHVVCEQLQKTVEETYWNPLPSQTLRNKRTAYKHKQRAPTEIESATSYLRRFRTRDQYYKVRKRKIRKRNSDKLVKPGFTRAWRKDQSLLAEMESNFDVVFPPRNSSIRREDHIPMELVPFKGKRMDDDNCWDRELSLGKENLYKDGEYDRQQRQLVVVVVSKVFCYLGELNELFSYVVGVGPLFDVSVDTDYDLTLIARAKISFQVTEKDSVYISTEKNMEGVVGSKLSGKMCNDVTTTDLVLTVTQMLRKDGFVGKFVECCGDSDLWLGKKTSKLRKGWMVDTGWEQRTFGLDCGFQSHDLLILESYDKHQLLDYGKGLKEGQAIIHRSSNTLLKKAMRIKRIAVKQCYHKARFKVRKRKISKKYIDVMSYVKIATSYPRRLRNINTKATKGGYDLETPKYRLKQDKKIVWSHFGTLLSWKYVVLGLACGVLTDEESAGVVQDAKSWLVSFVSRDSPVTRIGSSKADVHKIYVFWNGHVCVKAQYNFEGRYYLVKFLKLVGSSDLYLHLWIGSYVCGEWMYGNHFASAWKQVKLAEHDWLVRKEVRSEMRKEVRSEMRNGLAKETWRVYSGDRVLRVVQQFHLLLAQEIKTMGREFREIKVGTVWSSLCCLDDENRMIQTDTLTKRVEALHESHGGDKIRSWDAQVTSQLLIIYGPWRQGSSDIEERNSVHDLGQHGRMLIQILKYHDYWVKILSKFQVSRTLFNPKFLGPSLLLFYVDSQLISNNDFNNLISYILRTRCSLGGSIDKVQMLQEMRGMSNERVAKGKPKWLGDST